VQTKVWTGFWTVRQWAQIVKQEEEAMPWAKRGDWVMFLGGQRVCNDILSEAGWQSEFLSIRHGARAGRSGVTMFSAGHVGRA
ncbi:Uncharacterized protein DAT39_011968, partial [Clarias magur]